MRQERGWLIPEFARVEPHGRVALEAHWWNWRGVKTAESWFGHVAAVVVGFVLMVLGLAMGVSLVMLPVGIVVGLLGVAMFVGGLFGHVDARS